MKIVPIFAESLFSFHFDDEKDNEYDRNIELWTNAEYLLDFAKKYLSGIDYYDYVANRLEDAEQIIDLIDTICENKTENLEVFFRPLYDSEYSIVTLSLQKGKTKHTNRRNDLRLYAIKIDEDCFIITGGAIKVSQKMQENDLTNKELEKMQFCKEYLRQNGVFDSESFFELIYNDL